jgi:hypothetical protein
MKDGSECASAGITLHGRGNCQALLDQVMIRARYSASKQCQSGSHERTQQSLVHAKRTFTMATEGPYVDDLLVPGLQVGQGCGGISMFLIDSASGLRYVNTKTREGRLGNGRSHGSWEREHCILGTRPDGYWMSRIGCCELLIPSKTKRNQSDARVIKCVSHCQLSLTIICAVRSACTPQEKTSCTRWSKPQELRFRRCKISGPQTPHFVFFVLCEVWLMILVVPSSIRN